MQTTAIDISTVPPIRHREAMRLAETEYRRFADAMDALPSDAWSRPTDCTGWDVRALTGHVVGAMRQAASIRLNVKNQREAARRFKSDPSRQLVDHLTELQIESVAHMDVEHLVAEAERLPGPAAAGRRRTPALLRALVSFKVEAASVSERWRLGYFVDVILTRDTWMHRIDLARATGTDLELTADHDGRIVADIVAEWARRHGQPFSLELTGPAGGTYASGSSRPTITLDAVEFARILSERAQGEGLLATPVPF